VESIDVGPHVGQSHGLLLEPPRRRIPVRLGLQTAHNSPSGYLGHCFADGNVWEIVMHRRHHHLHLRASKLLSNVHRLQNSWELLALPVLLGWVSEPLCLFVLGVPKVESQIVISQPLNVLYKFNKDFIIFLIEFGLVVKV
jgi:hypothetical protein